MPSIDWTGKEVTSKSLVGCTFLEAFDSLGLMQWVQEPTFPRSGNILDLILASESDRIGRVEVLCPPPGCDHCPTALEYIFPGQAYVSNGLQPQRAWCKGNYEYKAINRKVTNIDWEIELAYLNANQAFNVLSRHLGRLVQTYVPQRPSRSMGVKQP